MATYATPSAPHESDEHRPITPHLFGFYDNTNDLEPSKHISLDELTELVTKSPYSLDKEDLPLIVPHDGQNNSQEATNSANYWAAVINIDATEEDFLSILNVFFIEDYSCKLLYFTTSSHGSEFTIEGAPKAANHYKIIIPFGEPFDKASYEAVSIGLNALGKKTVSEDFVFNSFYAPNEKVIGLNYEGDCFGEEYLVKGNKLFELAMDAYTQIKAKAPVKKAVKAEPSERAKQLCESFASEIKELLQLTNNSVSEVLSLLEMDVYVIDSIIHETIRNGIRKDELLILNKDENLNNHTKRDVWPHILFTYGAPYNEEELDKLKRSFFNQLRASGSGKSTSSQEKTLDRKINSLLENLVSWHIEQYNQRSDIRYRVDMFSHSRSVELQEKSAVFTLTHRPIVVRDDLATADYNRAVVNDYKLHFPEFDEFLQFLVMSRFSPDRKKAYLWLHAPSDWGKGFLKSILRNMGLSTELSVTEVESIFEGKPAGREPDDFKRSFCLIFDEFKMVKSELKQLENTIILTPKFKMASEVEVFAKLFLSAENVSSLVGASGIEDQLANRFSCIVGKGVLHNRPLFNTLGSGEYLRHVTGYAQSRINLLVELMQQRGLMRAEKAAEVFINEFHAKHSIDKLGQRLSESLVEIADEFLESLYCDYKLSAVPSQFLFLNSTGGLCLRNGGKPLSDWLFVNKDPNELATLKHKTQDILVLISQDGTGKPRPVHNPQKGTSQRAMLLKPSAI